MPLRNAVRLPRLFVSKVLIHVSLVVAGKQSKNVHAEATSLSFVLLLK